MNGSNRKGFDRIIGLDTAKTVLKRAVSQHNPSHAYMLTGMCSVGKLTLAMEFAKALNCENPDNGNACGECAVCRAIEHENFPDIRIYPPDKVNTTSIDSMRTMRDMSSFHPMRGQWKINIIEQADTLNEESANCILKLLEEPPDYLINILLYRNDAAALATIRSRCQVIRLFQSPLDELAQRLTEDFGADSEHAQFLASYSQGCPGNAITLLDDTQFQAERDGIAKIISEIPVMGTKRYLKLAAQLRSGTSDSGNGDDDSDVEPDEPSAKKKPKMNARDTILASLDSMVVWYRDILAAKLQGESAALVNSDRRSELLRQANFYADEESIRLIIKFILATRRSILGNANAQIQTEAMVMKMAYISRRK